MHPRVRAGEQKRLGKCVSREEGGGGSGGDGGIDPQTTLFAAARVGHGAVVVSLLAGDATANRANPREGGTPLMAAAEKGCREVLERLLEAFVAEDEEASRRLASERLRDEVDAAKRHLVRLVETEQSACRRRDVVRTVRRGRRHSADRMHQRRFCGLPRCGFDEL